MLAGVPIEPHPVTIRPLPPQRFAALLGDDYVEVEEAIVQAGELFEGRAVWHLNSTARGGGVVELLTSLLAYARGAGVDARWTVIGGDDEFFKITKRIHNRLHGYAGDGGELGAAERSVYDRVLEANAEALSGTVRGDDVVFLHDPQTAGLVEPLKETGASVVWRCHVGADRPNELARTAWEFLRPDVERADAYVFSRQEFAWEGLDPDRVWIVPALDRRLLTQEPGAGRRDREGDASGRGAGSGRRQAGADLRSRGWDAGQGGPGGGDRPGRAAPRRPALDLPGVALGPAQGSRRRAGGLRAASR